MFPLQDRLHITKATVIKSMAASADGSLRTLVIAVEDPVRGRGLLTDVWPHVLPLRPGCHSLPSSLVPLLRQSCAALLCSTRQRICCCFTSKVVFFKANCPASRQALCCPHWVCAVDCVLRACHISDCESPSEKRSGKSGCIAALVPCCFVKPFTATRPGRLRLPVWWQGKAMLASHLCCNRSAPSGAPALQHLPVCRMLAALLKLHPV